MAKTILALVSSIVLLLFHGARSASFSFKNNCAYTVWPATLSAANSSPLSQTGFMLDPGASTSLDAPASWSGRMWGRTQCSTDSAGKFVCATGDCGSGQVACNGAGGAPPTTLVEFTLNGDGGKDFYDTSLVDGFNLPMSIAPQGGGGCSSTSCPANVNSVCPTELQSKTADGNVVGCKSACAAFGDEKYCCTGAFNSPDTCKPTDYSKIFKTACPQAYSYAYDDKSSTVTCPTGGSYAITYCP